LINNNNNATNTNTQIQHNFTNNILSQGGMTPADVLNNAGRDLDDNADTPNAGMNTPGMNTPGMNTPGNMNNGMNTPGMNTPGNMGMGTPGMNTPGGDMMGQSSVYHNNIGRSSVMSNNNQTPGNLSMMGGGNYNANSAQPHNGQRSAHGHQSQGQVTPGNLGMVTQLGGAGSPRLGYDPNSTALMQQRPLVNGGFLNGIVRTAQGVKRQKWGMYGR